MASGCFSIEQEIFLNADGSGELVVFISLPDLPEKMGGAELTAKKSPYFLLTCSNVTVAMRALLAPTGIAGPCIQPPKWNVDGPRT